MGGYEGAVSPWPCPCPAGTAHWSHTGDGGSAVDSSRISLSFARSSCSSCAILVSSREAMPSYASLFLSPATAFMTDASTLAHSCRTMLSRRAAWSSASFRAAFPFSDSLPCKKNTSHRSIARHSEMAYSSRARTHSYWASSSSGEGLELQFSMERQSPELLYVHVAWFSTSTSGSPEWAFSYMPGGQSVMANSPVIKLRSYETTGFLTSSMNSSLRRATMLRNEARDSISGL
mmetsp:Transcript_82743/g.138073  ORF Transcript_82743/g.138073 Transcript_82743/m.138073 type:complete len:233 (+) Transcript_82743:1048-1746(+)